MSDIVVAMIRLGSALQAINIDPGGVRITLASWDAADRLLGAADVLRLSAGPMEPNPLGGSIKFAGMTIAYPPAWPK